MPFPVTALQWTGASKFMAGFETAEPKLNGPMDRLHDSWRYKITPSMT